jgi:hypothetical protein
MSPIKTGTVEKPEAPKNDLAARLAALVQRNIHNYDTRPVSRAEWDEACGDTSLYPAATEYESP